MGFITGARLHIQVPFYRYLELSCFKVLMPYYSYQFILAGFIPYARLYTQIPIWSYLGPGPILIYLELSGASWSYLALPDYTYGI